MAVDEIEQRVEGGPRVVLHETLHPGRELARREPDDRSVGVLRVAVDEPDHGAPEAVVRRSVRLVAEEPRRSVLPLFAEDEGVGVGRLHRPADPPHEVVREAVHHVEAPAARALADPAPGDAVGTGEQLDHLGTLDELGQRVEPEPALVIRVGAAVRSRHARRGLVHGRLAEREPGAVRGAGRLAGTDLLEARVAVEPR